MRGRIPKDPAQRSRKGRTATLELEVGSAQAIRGPDLPTDREWHPAVLDWWDRLRESPQALFYTPLDWWQAQDVAVLRDLWHRSPSSRLYAVVARASLGLGLDRIDQRRNGWKLNLTAAPAQETPQLPEPERAPQPRRVDPRKVLRSVPGGRRASA